MQEIVNPILPGFYPDPSIVRVEDDFYLVTSSFSYFPGVPVFHSRDLRHWEQIGHVLTRPEELPLDCREISRGIWAPTIRYHEGVFYVITTNYLSGVDGFFCTATDPAGPWSAPRYIEGSAGIDPSLFFDADGRCYMTGNDGGYGGIAPFVWGCEIDLNRACLKGERKELWRGALRDCAAPEAPHLYYRDGWYYLMIAEGGTEHFHAVTIARSRQALGPYRGYEGNPILTHRQLGFAYPICATGHADLVQLKDGQWYMVLLASRPYGGYHKNLGRETFITPVDWSGDWPVVNPGRGVVEDTCPAPDLPTATCPERNDNDWQSLCWNYLGSPVNRPCRIEGDTLYIRCVKAPFLPSGEEESPEMRRTALGFYGRRQRHMSFDASVRARLPERNNAVCGMTVVQNAFASLCVEMYRKNGGVYARALRSVTGANGELTVEYLGETPLSSDEAGLSISAHGQQFTLTASGRVIAQSLGGHLGSETCGGFVGAYVGCYASGRGTDDGAEAAFTGFCYQGLPASASAGTR